MGDLRQVCRYRYGDECRHGAPKQERQQPRGLCRGVYQQGSFRYGHQRLRLIPQTGKSHQEPREQLYQGYQQPFQEQDSHEQYHIYGLEKQTEQTSFPWNKVTFLDPQRSEAAKRTGKYKDVPLIVAPGQEDEYLEVKARQDAEAEKEKKAEPQE